MIYITSEKCVFLSKMTERDILSKHTVFNVPPGTTSETTFGHRDDRIYRVGEDCPHFLFERVALVPILTQFESPGYF